MFRQISTCFLGVGEGGCWFCNIEATVDELFEEGGETDECWPFYRYEFIF